MGVTFDLMIKVISTTARTITFEIVNNNYFFTSEDMDIYVNDNFAFTINKNIFTLANLQPDTHIKFLSKVDQQR